MSTIGASAPSSHTLNLDALLSTTLFNYKKTMFDNIFKSTAFLAALRKLDGIEYLNGGERIARQIMYGKNTTVKSYSGYETVDVTPQDGITQCFYEWREIAGSISISRKEERQNSGEAQIMDLLKQKTMQAEMSIKEKVTQDIISGTVSSATFVPGNSAKDLNPLGYFFRKAKATDPTTGGNVGNISAATYAWWRHNVGSFGAGGSTGDDFTVTVTTRDGLKYGLLKLYNLCVRGADGSGPNLIVSGASSYEAYELSLDASLRYSDQDMADMGFDTIKLKGATWVWDENMIDIYTGTSPVGGDYSTATAQAVDTAFFLNTKFFKLYMDSETDFVTTPFVRPENQTARTALILFMGNTGVTNMRKHGVAAELKLDITS
jgi:hypothetical protein